MTGWIRSGLEELQLSEVNHSSQNNLVRSDRVIFMYIEICREIITEKGS